MKNQRLSLLALLAGSVLLALSGCSLGGVTNGSSPSTPTGLAVSGSAATSLTISWSSVSGATSYDLYRSTSASGSYSSVETGSATSYSDTSLSANTTYYYEVSASNSSGSSSKSGDVSGTTLPYQTLSTGSTYSYGSADYMTADSSGNLYIDGTLNVSSTSNPVPCYWKNGTLTVLSMSSSDTYAEVGQISVNSTSGTVDIAGSEGTSSSNLQPVYWTNSSTSPITLGLGSGYSTGSAEGIVNTGTDTYITGYETTSASVNVPVYWDITSSSGTSPTPTVILPSGYTEGEVFGLVEDSSGNVYAAGYAQASSSSNPIAFAWGGVNSGSSVYSLNLDSTAAASSIHYGLAPAVDSSNDLYISGLGNDGTDNLEYWEVVAPISSGSNSIQSHRDTSTTPSYAREIALDSSGTIYIAGYTEPSGSTAATPYYWTTNASSSSVTNNSLPVYTSQTYSQAYGIAVSGSKFYISGAVGATSSTQTPVYWPNGK